MSGAFSFYGRIGPNKPKLGGTLGWNADTKSYVLCFNDAANPEFWLQVVVPDALLEQVKTTVKDE